jgi:uncharacterized membrane protein YkoI
MPAKLADDDAEKKVPPTPGWVMIVLIVLLLGLAGTTVKLLLYPSPPEAWSRVYAAPGMPAEEVNKILSESQAIMDSVKTSATGTVESWSLKHRTGTWSTQVTLKKTDKGEVFDSALLRCDVTNLPSCTRTWEFPEKSDGKKEK